MFQMRQIVGDGDLFLAFADPKTNTLLGAHSIFRFVVSLATYGIGRVAMHLEEHIGEIAHVVVIELRPDQGRLQLARRQDVRALHAHREEVRELIQQKITALLVAGGDPRQRCAVLLKQGTLAQLEE